MIHGVVNLNKPKDITSHDAVSRMRKLLGQKRIGHTGTLDPLAQGVLPLCLGDATRIAEYLSGADKTYRAMLRFGYSSDTLDIRGRLKKTKAVNISEANLEEILPSFIGTIEQLPPMYSAISINGRRLYQLAREGKTIERPVRTVHIHWIELIDQKETEYGLEAELRVKCSKGTYIRSLVSDIGKATGSDAILIDLIREESGGYSLESSLTFAELEKKIKSGEEIFHVLSPKQLPLPIIELSYNEKTEIQFGRNIPFDERAEMCIKAGDLCQLIYQNQLLGIAEISLIENKLFVKPKKNLANPLDFYKNV